MCARCLTRAKRHSLQLRKSVTRLLLQLGRQLRKRPLHGNHHEVIRYQRRFKQNSDPRKSRKSAICMTCYLENFAKTSQAKQDPIALAGEEFRRYFATIAPQLTDDPLKWWGTHSQEYPLLSTISKRCIWHLHRRN